MKTPQFPSQQNETPPAQNPKMNKKHFVPMQKMPAMPKFPRDGTERPCPAPSKKGEK
jgi:hypothetical protein